MIPDAEKEDNMAAGQPTVYELGQQRDQKMSMEEAWAILRDGFNDVYTGKLSDMSIARYMELYTLVTKYHLCVPPASVTPPTRLADLLGDLYQRLQDFLKTHLDSLVVRGTGLTGEAVVCFYNQTLDDYNFSSKILNGMCSFLNRTFVWHQREKGALEVYEMALVSWREFFLAPLREQLTSGLLKIIEMDRNGQTVDLGHVRRATASFLELAINNDHPSRIKEEDKSPQGPDLFLYKEAFENIFLIETQLFYSRESADYLARHSFTRYMMRVERRLIHEELRTLTYLHASTLKPLIKICEQALIENHLEVFCEEFPKLLKGDQDEDIRRMFRLVSRTSNGLEHMRTLFQDHVRQQGLAAVERAGDDAVRDPRLYANTLLRVYNKYKALVTSVFSNDEGFSGALRAACEKFVNSNYVTRPPNSPRKSPELLAKYCDMLLLKNAKNTDVGELEEAQKEAVILLTFIEAKDVFQRFYSRMMAMRLVQNTSASEEAETSMVMKFREVCGHEYTPKLLRMIQDIRLSKILNDTFEESLADAGEDLEVDFSVLVLTTGSWPFSQESPALTLPVSLERCLHRFAQFYNARQNRKLTWLYHVSEGEAVTDCFGRTYILQATAVQMAVLLQYNHSLSCTVQQLQEATSLDMHTLQQVLQVLLEVRLLSLEQEQTNVQGRRQLPSDAVVSLDEEFSNKRVLVDIRPGLKTEAAKADQDTTDKTIKANRKFAVQAAIVRIMKYRQTLSRPEIVAEVTRLLSTRFKPEVLEIRECINILVEKGYLEPAGGDEGTYNYVA